MTSPELDLKPIHDARQAGLAEDEICIREGIVLKIAPESRFGFEFFCWRSPPMVKEMDCFIKYIKDTRQLLDVGAFHGIFSLVFNRIGLGALAIEPSDDAFKVLSENAKLNGFGWEPMNIALSDHEGALDMHAEDGHWVERESRRFPNIDNPHQGRCLTGDEICEIQGFNPITIKIDVEGHEAKVLRGLQQTIQRMRPVIFIEVHLNRLKAQGESIRDVIDLLPNYEFIWTETDQKIDPMNLPPLEEHEHDLRFVCLPCP